MKKGSINNRYFFVKDAIPFIGIGIAATIISACFGYIIFALFSGIITFFIAFFFRDPERVFYISGKEILAPADGRIIEVKEMDDTVKVSIFMSLLDVHVNRIPVTGVIKKISYMPGRFLRADKEEASQKNEKNIIVLVPEQNLSPFVLVQIAGLIARRIICWVEEGDRVFAGQRFGLICFGSRVELFIDKKCDIIVKEGQKVKAGISVIGYMP